MSNTKEKAIPLSEIVDIYAKTIEFLKLIHGEHAYEIRMLEEGTPKNKFSRSFLVNGDDVYEGNKVRTNSLTRENYNIWYEIVMRDVWTKYGPIGFNDCGIFFSPNSPDFDEIENCTLTDKDIRYINCQFIDIDASKEIRGDKEILKQWKKEQIKKVEQWLYPPSIIVLSKNGIHCYWLLDNGKKELFRYIQLQLAFYFDGDEKCQNPSRLLRLPGFMHRKDRADQYYVFIYKMKNIRYSQEEISKALPKITAEQIEESVKKQREHKPVVQLEPGQEKRLWKLVKNHIEVNRNTGNKITCRCPMPEHEDKNPSAWIDKEYQWFHCGSTHCGISMPLEELAEELGWDDVLVELNRPKYKINILNAYNKVKKHMVNVSDCPVLELSYYENEIVEQITKKVYKIFLSRGQVLNIKHRKYIRDIVNILFKSEKTVIPDLIPLDMGGGKSTIIEVFIVEMLKLNQNYGVILIKERIEDAVNTAQKINTEIDQNVAYVMYGFKQEECQRKLSKCDTKYRRSKNDKLIRYSSCEHRKYCRYYNQYIEQQKYPILIITYERLFNDVRNDTFAGKYRFFNKVFVREKLIIDEKPKLIYDSIITSKQFEKYSQSILGYLLFANDDAHNEFEKAIEMIRPLFSPGEQKRENILPIDPEFNFSKNFWIEFGCMAHYTDDYHKFPEAIENLIRYGGHRTTKTTKNGEQAVKVCTSHYCIYTYGNQFHSIIFDGTADIDFTYKHKNYRIFSFEPLREYSNFYFYECDYLKSTKTEMSKENILNAFIEQVKQISEEHPNSKIYLPVYMNTEEYIRDGLKEYIEQGKIKVAHYGNTKGSNDFLDCDIVIIQGFLHKTEDHYVSIHRAITKKFADDLEATYIDGLRRFNNKGIEHFKITDQNVDYTQEIKRSMQRDQSRDVSGKVYLFTNDTYLLEVLKWKFPGCQTVKWNPEKLLEERIVNNTHRQAKNEKLIYDFFIKNKDREKITFEDVVSSTGLDKTIVSRLLRKPVISGIISSLGFKRIKPWKEVYFIKQN
ncbi:MAG: RepB family DNA primase [Peptococcaceae bacterium]|nr:RepB family DNA primase [Peptococcaceae bacterium]